MQYILRRLGFYALAAWVSLTLNFLIPRLMPGDPAAAIFARFRGQLQPEQIHTDPAQDVELAARPPEVPPGHRGDEV